MIRTLVATKKVMCVSYFENHPLAWQNLLEALPDGTALLDGHGTILYANELLIHLTGYSREELVGQNVRLLVPPQHRDAEVAARQQHARNPNTRIIWSDRDLTVLCKDGSELSVDFALSPLAHEDKSWVVASIRDNSIRHVAERARAEAEQRFRLAFEDSMSPMILTNLQDEMVDTNDAFCEMLGRTRDELIGKDSKHFTYSEDVGITEATHRRIVDGDAEKVRYVKRYLHKDGRIIVAEVSKSPARDVKGQTLCFVISERDITEERELTARLSIQALHDPLTGLANRALFEDRLTQAHARVVRQGGLGAVLLLDLDDFKGVNDAQGHVAGDQLLTAIARRLESVTRSSDTLCRFGGDEFLYLAEGLHSESEAEQVANRLLGALAEPFVIAGMTIEQHASIGIVVWDNTSSDSTDFVQNADVALYEAKRLNEGRYLVFTPSMHQRVVSRFTLVQELRQALHNGEISMHYQPIIDLSSNHVLGFEALMRWNHPERGSVPPSLFIPLAEKSGLIFELGAFALRHAVDAAMSWVPPRPETARPFVTVNLSTRQFHDLDLVIMIEELLRSSGLGPERLILEITEGAALQDLTATLGIMDRLDRLGIGIALDDFGTGFSSLTYLSLLHPRFIKIDQSFVRPVHESADNDTLLETIVTLGDKLKLTMLAEGIETTAQLGRLRNLGGELGQGYLFSPAVPAEQVTAMINRIPESWEPRPDHD